jgi:hypothetical protein
MADSDWLFGARQIGAYIQRSPKSTYHLLEAGQLPAVKFAGRWQARKSRIDATLDGLVEHRGGAANAAPHCPRRDDAGLPEDGENNEFSRPTA